MKYDKKKTFEAAEKHLKAKQNIKPDKRNYFDNKGWYNKHHGSMRGARQAYARALRLWKDKGGK